MVDQAFKEAAQTSPMGSFDADIQWMDNEGKIIAPTLHQKVGEYVFDIPKVAKMRAFHTVPVPAKNYGKTIFKRVRRVYPTSRLISTSAVMPAVKRVCIFAPSFRSNQEPIYFDSGVKNAGFWDDLSAKVHTRNALYSDNVLPWTENALPLRQKHWRDSTINTPTSPAVDVAMVLNLEKMALASTTLLRIADMTDPVIKDVRLERRKGRLPSITSLPTIEEESEPGTPDPVRATVRSIRRRQRRWSPTRYCTSPIRRSTKPARVSPSPERSPAKRIDDTPVPSTPTRVLFSNTEVHISPSKTSPVPETPLRVFSSNEPEPITSAKTTMDASLEDSVLEQTRGQTLQTVDVYFGPPKSERRLSDVSRATSIPEYSVDAREHLDIFGQPITAVRTLAEVATGVETAVSDSRVIVEKIDGKLFVRFKLPSTYADVFNSQYPSTTTTVAHGDLDTPHEETDVEDMTRLSTNTDELIAGLPATPTHIILGGSPLTYQDGPVSPSSPILPSPTPAVSTSSTPIPKRVDPPTPSIPALPTLAATRVEDQSVPNIPGSPALVATRDQDQSVPASPGSLALAAATIVEDESGLAITTSPTPALTRVEDQSIPASKKIEDQVSISASPAPATRKVEGHSPSSPPKNTLGTLLDSPFAPSCAGTPKRPTPASPSRALEHDIPSEPREISSRAAASQSSDLAEDLEAATRAYLDKFLTEHKASKAARSTIQESSLPSQATGTGSLKPRTPLGHIDANTASPMKAEAKRRADDEEEADVGKPPAKRGRRGSASNAKAGGEAPLRRSSRVRAKVQEIPAEANSRIPVRVGSNVFDGPAAGGETMEADLASVTRANTRRNKGKAVPPAEVLARQRQDPPSRRMQELREVHDARAARTGKVARKGVQWGENEEVVYDPEEEDDEHAEEAEKNTPAVKTKVGRTKKRTSKDAGRQTKVTEPKPKVTKATTAKKTAKARPATPIKRQTRASAKRDREMTAAI